MRAPSGHSMRRTNKTTGKSHHRQVLSNAILDAIRRFLPRYFQDSDISFKILQDQTFSSKLLPRFRHIFQDLARSDIFFQDTCKNNALSSKVFEMKSDRFLQKMYGSSTRVYTMSGHFILCNFNRCLFNQLC